MKTKHIFLYLFLSLTVSSCFYTAIYSYWDASYIYRADDFRKYDSIFNKNDSKDTARNNIIMTMDSSGIYFMLNPKECLIPIIPILYSIEISKNTPYYFYMFIHNGYIAQTIDSIGLTIYNNLNTIHYSGGYKIKLNKYNVFEDHFHKIKIKLKKTDVIFANIDLFFNDSTDRKRVHHIKKLKFTYDKHIISFSSYFDI